MDHFNTLLPTPVPLTLSDSCQPYHVLCVDPSSSSSSSCGGSPRLECLSYGMQTRSCLSIRSCILPVLTVGRGGREYSVVTRCVFRELHLLTPKPEDPTRESKTTLEPSPGLCSAVSTSTYLTQPVCERSCILSEHWQ